MINGQADGILAVEATSRVLDLGPKFDPAECPFAAVYRVSATRAIIPQLVKIRVLLFTEVFHATTSVAIGKIKRLNRLYYLRNVGVPNNPRPFQSWRDWYVKDFDEFFEQYREFRSMVMYLVAQTGKDMDADRLRRTIDMAFMVYGTRIPYAALDAFLPYRRNHRSG